MESTTPRLKPWGLGFFVAKIMNTKSDIVKELEKLAQTCLELSQELKRETRRVERQSNIIIKMVWAFIIFLFITLIFIVGIGVYNSFINFSPETPLALASGMNGEI